MVRIWLAFTCVEALDLLRGRPLDLDGIDNIHAAETEVEAQITLRHHAGPAVHLIHLDMFAGDDADARANGGSIAFGADQLELDPVLLVAALRCGEAREGRSCSGSSASMPPSLS